MRIKRGRREEKKERIEGRRKERAERKNERKRKASKEITDLSRENRTQWGSRSATKSWLGSIYPQGKECKKLQSLRDVTGGRRK
jgi:hypothetical protein